MGRCYEPVASRRRFLGGAIASLVAQSLCVERSLAGDADSFEAALTAIAAQEILPAGAAGRIEAKELELSGFGAADLSVPKSTTRVSERAFDLIVTFEVSSEAYYNKFLLSPYWPGGRSGVTIGIGYDLGYVPGDQFEIDWDQYLELEGFALLSPVVGLKGRHARVAVSAVGDIAITFSSALSQFGNEALPRYVGLTELNLENTELLSEDSLGALVSLTYNRGASYNSSPANDPNGRFAEMRAIAAFMRRQEFGQIPDTIRSMKRLWAGKGLPGLLERRDLEAELFEIGLS